MGKLSPLSIYCYRSICPRLASYLLGVECTTDAVPAICDVVGSMLRRCIEAPYDSLSQAIYGNVLSLTIAAILLPAIVILLRRRYAVQLMSMSSNALASILDLGKTISLFMFITYINLRTVIVEEDMGPVPP